VFMLLHSMYRVAYVLDYRNFTVFYSRLAGSILFKRGELINVFNI